MEQLFKNLNINGEIFDILCRDTKIEKIGKLDGDRMILISDSMRATGLSDGEYEFGGQKMTVTNGTARTSYGTLAGSTSTLLDCVKCAIDFGIPEKDAFKMASETPAKLIGLNCGKIAEGYDCDLIVLDDNNNIDTVIINGKILKGGAK